MVAQLIWLICSRRNSLIDHLLNLSFATVLTADILKIDLSIWFPC